MKIDMNTSYSSKNVWGFVTSGTLLNLTVGGLMVLGAGSIGVFHARDLASMAAFPSLDCQNQNASSIIGQDIRRACSVDSGSSSQIVLHVNATEGATTVTYTFDPAAHTLTRADAQGSNTVLSGVDAFSFSLFQRPGLDAAYGSLVPASANNAKMVGCRWSCSRKIAGEKLHSESIELTPIVLRNRS